MGQMFSMETQRPIKDKRIKNKRSASAELVPRQFWLWKKNGKGLEIWALMSVWIVWMFHLLSVESNVQEIPVVSEKNSALELQSLGLLIMFCRKWFSCNFDDFSCRLSAWVSCRLSAESKYVFISCETSVEFRIPNWIWFPTLGDSCTLDGDMRHRVKTDVSYVVSVDVERLSRTVYEEYISHVSQLYSNSDSDVITSLPVRDQLTAVSCYH